eukprot:3921807-Rhodomonas_salina.1
MEGLCRNAQLAQRHVTAVLDDNILSNEVNAAPGNCDVSHPHLMRDAFQGRTAFENQKDLLEVSKHVFRHMRDVQKPQLH